MRFNCPGKVFFAGEYACLDGGPAFLGTCEPRFELTLEKSLDTKAGLPFHPNSPAGQYYSKNLGVFGGHKISWKDPYATPIGVGSSSAQFLLLLAAACHLRQIPVPEGTDLLNEYWSVIDSSQSLRPSGVDVLAQRAGGPVVTRGKVEKLQNTLLPDTDLVLVFTGEKVRTHAVLTDLRSQGFPEIFKETLSTLNGLTEAAIGAWKLGNAQRFGIALSAYQEALLKGGLADKTFTESLRELRKIKGVLGAKGAGAQGGDCFILLAQSETLEDLQFKFAEKGWQIFALHWTAQGLAETSS